MKIRNQNLKLTKVVGCSKILIYNFKTDIRGCTQEKSRMCVMFAGKRLQTRVTLNYMPKLSTEIPRLTSNLNVKRVPKNSQLNFVSQSTRSIMARKSLNVLNVSQVFSRAKV